MFEYQLTMRMNINAALSEHGNQGYRKGHKPKLGVIAIACRFGPVDGSSVFGLKDKMLTTTIPTRGSAGCKLLHNACQAFESKSVCIDGGWLQKVKWLGRVGAAPRRWR